MIQGENLKKVGQYSTTCQKINYLLEECWTLWGKPSQSMIKRESVCWCCMCWHFPLITHCTNPLLLHVDISVPLCTSTNTSLLIPHELYPSHHTSVHGSQHYTTLSMALHCSRCWSLMSYMTCPALLRSTLNTHTHTHTHTQTLQWWWYNQW